MGWEGLAGNNEQQPLVPVLSFLHIKIFSICTCCGTWNCFGLCLTPFPLLTYRYSQESETSSGEHYLDYKHALDSVLSTQERNSRNKVTLDLRGKKSTKRGNVGKGGIWWIRKLLTPKKYFSSFLICSLLLPTISVIFLGYQYYIWCQ